VQSTRGGSVRKGLLLVVGILAVAALGRGIAFRGTDTANYQLSDAPGPVGVWVDFWDGKLSGLDSFRFDGHYLTLRLITRKRWMWHSEDHFYRVRTKWEGEDLYWLPPFGSWEKFYAFRDGRFQNEDGRWVWRKVSEESLPELTQPLLVPRAPHDYAITPSGGFKPGWRGKTD
jgi:hypothetical protein